jgi:hypothetical protein
MGLSALFCLLVAMVCCPPLPLARFYAAGLTAIALTSVARAANHEDQVAVRPHATPGTKRAFGLGSCCHLSNALLKEVRIQPISEDD